MLDFVNFIRSKMSEYFEFKVVRGSNADELNVKPAALVLADFYNLLVKKQTMDNINNWRLMTDAELDIFGGKFFMKRIVGDYATGFVRIWVDIAADYLIPDTFVARASDGGAYNAVTYGTVRAGSLTQAESSYGKYYFDVNVIARETGTSFTKEAGQITSVSGVDFDYKFVSNPESLTNGIVIETNEQYANRLKYALNDRSMANNRSLYAGLRERFPVIQSMYIAGSGNRLMTRDLLKAVDATAPSREASFLGKTKSDNVIRHSAFYGTFPPEPWSRGAINNPLSVNSLYRFPPTVEAVNPIDPDPAYHGYPIYQEAEDDMYRGLYNDDFIRFMSVATRDIFNSIDDVIANSGATTIPPSWMAGAHGRSNGDFGLSGGTVTSKDIISIPATSSIQFKGGTGRPITTCKDIKKRTGIKISGSIVVPATFDGDGKNAYIQICAGSKLFGDNLDLINSFSGLGFGIQVHRPFSSSPGHANAIVYFVNNGSPNSLLYYSAPTSAPAGYATAMKEQPIKIQARETYNFEFIINGDASLSLTLEPANTSVGDGLNGQLFTLSPVQDSVLVTEYANTKTSSSYGSYLSTTVDSKNAETGEEWIVNRLKVVDTTAHTPHAMFIFNVDDLEEPLDVVFRGYGQGYSNGAIVRGHSAYVWNIEIKGPIQGDTSLSSGGWELLPDISDDGTRDAIASAYTQRLSGIDRYTVTTRYGRSIILLFVANGSSHYGTSKTAIGDVNAEMVIDYIKLRDQLVDSFHGGHKCDVYVNTLRNADEQKIETAVLTKRNTEDYFVISADRGNIVPVESITSIVDNVSRVVIPESQYSIRRLRDDYSGTYKDVLYIITESSDEVEVQYTTYPGMKDLQQFFDGRDFGRLVGDYLVRHKIPVYLDMGIVYAGEYDEAAVADAVKAYFDENVDRIFNISNMFDSLFADGYVSNIQRPMTVSYDAIDVNNKPVSGTFSEYISIDDNQFFRIRTLSVSRQR